MTHSRLWSYCRPRSWWNWLKLSWPDLHTDQQNKEKLLWLRWFVTLKCPWLPGARDPLAISVWKMGLLSCWLVVVEWCVRPRGVEQRSTRPAPDRDCTKRGAWWALLAWVAGTCNSDVFLLFMLLQRTSKGEIHCRWMTQLRCSQLHLPQAPGSLDKFPSVRYVC